MLIFQGCFPFFFQKECAFHVLTINDELNGV